MINDFVVYCSKSTDFSLYKRYKYSNKAVLLTHLFTYQSRSNRFKSDD